MTLFQAFGQFAGQAVAVTAISGYEIITPSSATTSSGTVTIGSNGTVNLTTCTNVTINGVFTSNYDVYMALFSGVGSDGNLAFRYAASGTPDTSGIYDRIYTVGDGASTTTTAGQNATSHLVGVMGAGTRATTLYRIDFYRPTDTSVDKNVICQGSTPTTTANIANWNTGTQVDSLTSFDGFHLFEGNSTFTGEISVYGVRKS